MHRRRRLLRLAAVLLVVLAVAGGLSFRYVQAAAFIVQAAGFDGFARMVAHWVTIDVSEREISIPTKTGRLRARVFIPRFRNGPPALVVPGVHAGGIEEPRLVQFARDVASTGRIVVTAELPDLKSYSITPQATDEIEDAAVWLASQQGYAPRGRVAMMGISFAGGLSIVAAGRAGLRERVALVMSFGGHGDLPRTLRYLCTGVQPDGTHFPPHDYGVAIILLGVADRVVPPEQAEPLQEAIRAFLHASHVDMWDKTQAQEEFARARRMAGELPEPARTLMGYVNDRDVANLGPVLLPHLATLGGDPALSPERSPPPAAPVYLLHGTGDNVIPAVESTLLASRLRERNVPVRHLATPLITHAEVDGSAAARAFVDLVRFWGALFREK